MRPRQCKSLHPSLLKSMSTQWARRYEPMRGKWVETIDRHIQDQPFLKQTGHQWGIRTKHILDSLALHLVGSDCDTFSHNHLSPLRAPRPMVRCLRRTTLIQSRMRVSESSDVRNDSGTTHCRECGQPGQFTRCQQHGDRDVSEGWNHRFLNPSVRNMLRMKLDDPD